MNEPAKPENSFRVVLTLNSFQPRLDVLLLEALRAQDKNPTLKGISRKAFKELFYEKRIQIKGQNALPASSLATGTTYVDILGFAE